MGTVHLENERIRLGFDEGNGCLAELTDVSSGLNHLDRPMDARLFRVVCPSELWLSRFADAQDSERPVIERRERGISIRYDRVEAMDGAMDVSATVRVELPPESSEAIFTVELTNDEPGLIHEVHFPWVGGWSAPGRRDSYSATCGCQNAPLAPDTPETFSYNLMGSHRRRHFSYLSMQLPLFDLSNGTSGISYICYQDRPALGGMVVQNLTPEPDSFSLGFSWTHFPFVPSGATWQSPPVGIGVHGGDWHETADRLRGWLDTWWEAPSPPERFASSIGFQVIQIRNFDGLPNHRFEDIPELARAGLDSGIDDLCIWDPIAGVYLRPDDGDFWDEFDPTQSLDDLRAALSEARKDGANVSVLVNYRLIRGESSLYERIGEEQVQRTLSGTPVAEEWSNCSSAHAGFRTPYLSERGLALCQKSNAFRERAMDITKRTMDLGFTSLFIDQAFDQHPCFAENHGHESPGDTHEAAIDWFKDAADMVRRKGAESYVMGETTDVFGAQHLDLSWNWGWASSMPEVMRYTLPETLHCWIVDHQPAVLNRAFAMGFQMAFTTGMAEKSIDAYPQFATRVAELANLRKRCADYLVRGRFRDRAGLRLDGALGHVYDSPAGIAVAIAEVEGSAADVRASLDPTALGRSATGAGTLHRQDGADDADVAVEAGGGAQLSIRLAAFEVTVWTIPATPRRSEPAA